MILFSYIRKLIFILIIPGGLTLAGCYTCDEYLKSEPELTLTFEKPVSFSRVYALKPGPIDTIGGFNQFIIPLNLNSERTVYLFEAAGKTDTLELEYEANVELISGSCGFVVELTNLRSGSQTTFDSVKVQSTNYIVVR